MGIAVHSGKFENILNHHTNAIKYLMERGLAHEGAGGNNLIFLIHMGFIDILADVFTAQLGDGFRSRCYIRRSEKSNKITELSDYLNDVFVSFRQKYQTIKKKKEKN